MKNLSLHRFEKAGISLVEIIVSISMFLTGVVAVSGSFTVYTNLMRDNSETVQATILLEEGMEALVFLRDQTWSGNIDSVALGTPYYITWNGTAYATSTTLVSQPPFTRTYIFSAVERDGNDDIVASGGSVDPDTRSVLISVTNESSDVVASSSMYIHNLYE